jgi:hypothetical protein
MVIRFCVFACIFQLYCVFVLRVCLSIFASLLRLFVCEATTYYYTIATKSTS